MTKLQELQLKQSEIRERINTLLATENRTEEQDRELRDKTAEAQKLEPELRAALTVEDAEDRQRQEQAGDPEARERQQLRARTGIADFLAAAAGGAEVRGAAAEFAAACKVPAIGHLPLALLEPDRPGPEVRAITPGPAVDGPVQPHVPYLFERSAAASLGIRMPSVPSGQVQTPRITTAPPADTLEKDGAAPNTAAAVTMNSHSPKRISGQFEVRVEDLAVWPMLEDALRDTISGSMSNELDEQVFNGTAAGGDLSGLFKQATDVAVAGQVETFATGVARYAALVDGRYCYDWADIRACIGPATFAVYAAAFQSNGDVSLYDYLQSKMGSLRVSDRLPAVASDGQKGIVVLTAAMEAPRVFVWDALQVVRDPYSGAGAGKVVITATALVSDLYLPHGASQARETHPKVS